MKDSTRISFLIGALVPAFIAFFGAQYLIETFFPNVTLVDLGAFFALGLISGLFLTLFLARKTGRV